MEDARQRPATVSGGCAGARGARWLLALLLLMLLVPVAGCVPGPPPTGAEIVIVDVERTDGTGQVAVGEEIALAVTVANTGLADADVFVAATGYDEPVRLGGRRTLEADGREVLPLRLTVVPLDVRLRDGEPQLELNIFIGNGLYTGPLWAALYNDSDRDDHEVVYRHPAVGWAPGQTRTLLQAFVNEFRVERDGDSDFIVPDGGELRSVSINLCDARICSGNAVSGSGIRPPFGTTGRRGRWSVRVFDGEVVRVGFPWVIGRSGDEEARFTLVHQTDRIGSRFQLLVRAEDDDSPLGPDIGTWSAEFVVPPGVALNREPCGTGNGFLLEDAVLTEDYDGPDRGPRLVPTEVRFCVQVAGEG